MYLSLSFLSRATYNHVYLFLYGTQICGIVRNNAIFIYEFEINLTKYISKNTRQLSYGADKK